jgi:hypothetical protein
MVHFSNGGTRQQVAMRAFPRSQVAGAEQPDAPARRQRREH